MRHAIRRSIQMVALGLLLLGATSGSAEITPSSTVDLLRLIDVRRDTVSGTWTMDGNELVASVPDGTTDARLAIPFNPPEEYDFTMEFTRVSGHDAVVQMFRWNDSELLWSMGSNGHELELVAGNKKLTYSQDDAVTANGVKFVSVIKVRRHTVEVILNDKSVCTFDQPLTGATLQDNWSLPAGSSLGVGVWWGAPIRISRLEVSGSDASKPDIAQTSPVLHTDSVPDVASIAGATTHVSNPVSTIKSLEVYTTDSGMMLGQTSEVVLTVTRGNTSKMTSVRFVTPVGDEMCLARDEALRFIRVTYPNWYADTAELSFEDKYSGHDGGSIGAAVGTLILSAIQGFEIDPETAITGDISANGKVRAIGGLSAKIHGAIASKCTAVALPADNFDQLVDAVIYNGPSIVADIQVIGISNLDDAVAATRADRGMKLAQAMSLFDAIRQNIRRSPGYLHSNEAKHSLTQVLKLAPNHLSAKLLLMIAQDEEPTTLSATASMYYTFVAVRGMLPILSERSQLDTAQVPSTVVKDGLANLKRLRPIADESVRPLIDAWSRFIWGWSMFQRGNTTKETLMTQAQAIDDAMAQLQTDQDLMQKMLKEGI
jgi:hypothetical protein